MLNPAPLSYLPDDSHRHEVGGYIVSNSPPLADCFHHLIPDAVLLTFLFFTLIFLLITLSNLLTAIIYPSRGLAAQDFSIKLTPLLSKYHK